MSPDSNGWGEHKRDVLRRLDEHGKEIEEVRSEMATGFREIGRKIDGLARPGESALCKINRAQLCSLQRFNRGMGWATVGALLAIIGILIAVLLR